MKSFLICLTALFILGACTKTPKKDEEKIAYFMGYNLGATLKKQGLVEDVHMACSGLKDGFEEKKMRTNKEDAVMSFQNLIKEKRQKDKVMEEKNKKKGVDFLAQNKTKKGVKVTKSGLQYKVIKEGTGKKPTAKSQMSVHYRGRLIDGKEFDSSYKRNKPSKFTLNNVIPGWTEGFALMKEGAHYELYIPSELAYGERNLPNIPANSVLIFEVEFLKILK